MFISELMCAYNFSMHGEHRLCALPTQTLAPDFGIFIAAVHQQHGLAGLKRLIKYFKFVIGNAETGEKGEKGVRTLYSVYPCDPDQSYTRVSVLPFL
jgi:hypothetical protein